MIRINLLAADREHGKQRSRFQSGQVVSLVCSLILAAAAVGIGWWYWSLTQASAQLDQDLAAATREEQRLGTLIQQVQQFDQRKAQLQQRVTLIEELRKGQSGPVHLLDEISRAVPDGLWLTELKQAGAEVTLDGRCVTLTALSDLVSNLTASGYFATGVELLDSQVEAGVPGAGEIIRFRVKAQFAQPGA